MAETRTFQDLNLSNVFLFAAVMADEELCRKVLELILDVEISHVHISTEHSMFFRPDSHSIRLDVYASDPAHNQYDLEMQNANKDNIPKRLRYYVGNMDLLYLKPGEAYKNLPTLYVIFLCDFDPMGDGLYRYTCETVCRETGKPLNDGVQKILLSTKGTNEHAISPKLLHFLKFLTSSTSETAAQLEDAFVDELHNKIIQLKQDRQLEERYMLFEEMLNDKKEEGRNDMLHVILRMSNDGLQNEIPRLEYDNSFREEMFRKYQV